MKPITFGIKTAPQHTTYAAILQVWKQVDENPAFDHAWLFDHYAPIFSELDGPCLEGWTALAALADETSRIRLGLMVTGNTNSHLLKLVRVSDKTDVALIQTWPESLAQGIAARLKRPKKPDAAE